MRAAAAGIAALVLIAAGCTSEQVAQTPASARIAVSEKSVVYVQIQGGEVRAAMSAEGLQSAAPVKTGSEFTLPVPPDQLPSGVTAIKANLGVMNLNLEKAPSAAPAPYVVGQLKVFWTDARKAKWQYVSQLVPWAEANADRATSFKLPSPSDVKVNIETKPSEGKLGVGLRLTADGAAVTDVRKDGQPIRIQMTITDASGAVIASKVGSLSDLGFS
jgi:hypothetical protein